MISASSEELSKSEREGGEPTSVSARFAVLKKKRWVFPALLLIIAFVLIVGPTILLNIILKSMFPAESGLSLTYERARAGFLFGSA